MTQQTYRQRSLERVEKFFAEYDTARPAEILADIIHYCDVHGIDIESEMELAQDYSNEETSIDDIVCDENTNKWFTRGKAHCSEPPATKVN